MLSCGGINYKYMTIRNVAAGLALLSPFSANADTLTASELKQRMNDKEQYFYIQGVVTGFVVTRSAKNDETGATCIENWFFETPRVRDRIYAAFERFGDKAPSAILYAMATKECGK